jgi:LuxR family maltose regulon positive regulatory protein
VEQTDVVTSKLQSFAAYLRRYRERAGLTQEELAEKVRISAKAVGVLERGGQQHPYPRTVRALAQALALSSDERESFLAAVPRRHGVKSNDAALRGPTTPAFDGAPSVEILATKLHVPRIRPNRVERPRLTTRLDLALGCPLLLVSAPAGFGKTTLLADWLTQSRHPVAWLSLEPGDDDATRFLRYVVAAVQTVSPEVGQVARVILDSGRPLAPVSLLTGLTNDLARLPAETFLILDDYHVVQSGAIHELVGFLLDHLPSSMHLGIVTREDPPLPLARLRARGQLVEVRGHDLRFTLEEAATFLTDVMGLSLSPADVAILEARTEGWIAGLHLAALSLRERDDPSAFVGAFGGSHRFILDYLVDEVLRRESEEVHRFLLRTSVLDRLCAPLCDAIIDDPPTRGDAAPTKVASTGSSSQAMLERLERANLFLIPLDAERRWYRYHHLFADLLRARLRQDQPDLVPELHRQASAWFERQDLVSEAVDHALAAPDLDRAAQLIGDHALAIALRGDLATVSKWFDPLPPDLRQRFPRLFLVPVWIHASREEFHAVAPWLQEAEAALGPREDPEAAVIRDEIQAMRAITWCTMGDARGPELAHRVLADLPETMPLRGVVRIAMGVAHLWNGDARAVGETLAPLAMTDRARLTLIERTTGLAILAWARLAQGHLREALDLARRILAGAERGGELVPVTGAFSALELCGRISYEQGLLDESEHHLARCARLAKHWDLVGPVVRSDYLLAWTCRARGDHRGAAAHIERALTTTRQLSPLGVDPIVLESFQVRLWLDEGRGEAAAAWAAARRRKLVADEGPRTPFGDEWLALTRLAMAGEDWADAREILTSMLDVADARGHGEARLRALILLALVWQREGDLPRALETLGLALALAAPEGFVRTFVDEGEPMAALLRQAAARGIATSYAQQLLAAFPEPVRKSPPTADERPESASPGSRTSVPLIEPLTDREMEVLRLVEAGASNASVADRLVIAPSTVKRHLNNIYAKLDVGSRTQAVARARELSLL